MSISITCSRSFPAPSCASIPRLLLWLPLIRSSSFWVVDCHIRPADPANSAHPRARWVSFPAARRGVPCVSCPRACDQGAGPAFSGADRIAVAVGVLALLGGVVLLIVASSDTLAIVGACLLGLAGIALVSLFFLLVGEGEERNRGDGVHEPARPPGLSATATAPRRLRRSDCASPGISGAKGRGFSTAGTRATASRTRRLLARHTARSRYPRPGVAGGVDLPGPGRPPAGDGPGRERGASSTATTTAGAPTATVLKFRLDDRLRPRPAGLRRRVGARSRAIRGPGPRGGSSSLELTREPVLARARSAHARPRLLPHRLRGLRRARRSYGLSTMRREPRHRRRAPSCSVRLPGEVRAAAGAGARRPADLALVAALKRRRGGARLLAYRDAGAWLELDVHAEDINAYIKQPRRRELSRRRISAPGTRACSRRWRWPRPAGPTAAARERERSSGGVRTVAAYLGNTPGRTQAPHTWTLA